MNYIERISTENIKDSIRERIMPFVERLKSKSEVEGIVLLGGLSNNDYRNFMDKFSDVDISIFLSIDSNQYSEHGRLEPKIQEILPAWLPNFEFHVPFAENMIEINVHQQIIEFEENKNKTWDEAKKEAYAYSAEIIYDKKGRVKRLINEKVRFNEAHRKLRLAQLLGQYQWYVRINPLRQIERGFLENAHDLLNEGVEMFMEALYLFNRRYRPHKKWRIAMSFDLPWLPKEYQEKLRASMKVEGFGQESILRRRECLIELFEELQQAVTDEGDFDTTAYQYACKYVYDDRELKLETFADNWCSSMKQMKNMELIKGFINEYLISDINQIHDLHDIGVRSEYVSVMNQLKGVI